MRPTSSVTDLAHYILYFDRFDVRVCKTTQHDAPHNTQRCLLRQFRRFPDRRAYHVFRVLTVCDRCLSSHPPGMDLIPLFHLPVLLVTPPTRAYRLWPLGLPYFSPPFAVVQGNGSC